MVLQMRGQILQQASREATIKNVVEQQHDAKVTEQLQDGQTISEAFKRLEARTAQLSDALRKVEGHTNATPVRDPNIAGSVNFTKAMCTDMGHMHAKLLAIDVEVATSIAQANIPLHAQIHELTNQLQAQG